jgi:hypothetical protein
MSTVVVGVPTLATARRIGGPRRPAPAAARKIGVAGRATLLLQQLAGLGAAPPCPCAVARRIEAARGSLSGSIGRPPSCTGLLVALLTPCAPTVSRGKGTEGEKEEENDTRAQCSGHIRHFPRKSCVLIAGASLRAKRNFCSRNSTVELLHSGVSGAELKRVERSCSRQALN